MITNKIQKADTFEEYLGHDGISSSELKYLKQSPLHYLMYLKDKQQKKLEEKKAENATHFAKGSALHCLVLEPKEFPKRYSWFDRNAILPYPDKDYRTKANQEARDAFYATQLAKGITLLEESEWNDVQGMADSLLNTTCIADLIGESTTENSFYMHDAEYDADIRLRPDLISNKKPFILSLKSTVDASPEGYPKQCLKYGYHEKEAFYFDYLNKFFEGEREFTKVMMAVVENTYPYYAAMYFLEDEMLEIGRHNYQEYLLRYKYSKQENNFMGYNFFASPSEKAKGIMPLSLPIYAQRALRPERIMHVNAQKFD